MEQNRQIEEMANDIAYSCADMAYNGCGDITCCGCLAKELYEQNYRKLPKGAVVLTREEAERFRGQTVNIAKVKAQARKETAREIIQKIKQTAIPTGVSKYSRIKFLETSEEELDAIAKQYGVEVE